MGIGTIQTLHDYPDARVRAKNSEVHIILPSNKSNPDGSLVSDGDSVIVEGKRSGSTFNVHQLIATAVLTSFTESKLHPELNPLISVIMMSTLKAQICFYDC